MPTTPAKRSIDSFFAPVSPSKRTASSNGNDEVTQPAIDSRKRTSRPASAQHGHAQESTSTKKRQSEKGKAKEIETMMLDDDDDDDPREDKKPDRPSVEIQGQDDDYDDDIIIQEPQPRPSEPSPSKPATRRPSPPIASIFKAKGPATPKREAKLVKEEDAVKEEEAKPRVKASPTKMLSIFDTSSASSSTANTQSVDPIASSSNVSASQSIDTPLFSFAPDPSFFKPHLRTPFSYLTSALVLLSATKSRLLIQQVLTNLLRTVIELDPNTLESVVYLLSNKIGPTYEEGTELGVGWQVLSKAIKVSHFSEDLASTAQCRPHSTGDLGSDVSKAQSPREQARRPRSAALLDVASSCAMYAHETVYCHR